MNIWTQWPPHILVSLAWCESKSGPGCRHLYLGLFCVSHSSQGSLLRSLAQAAVQSTPTGIWRAVRAPAGGMGTIEWPSGISLVFFQMSLFFWTVLKGTANTNSKYTRMIRYVKNVYILDHLWHVQVTHRVYRPRVMMEKLCCLRQWSDGQRSGHTLWDSHLAGGYKHRSQEL